MSCHWLVIHAGWNLDVGKRKSSGCRPDHDFATASRTSASPTMSRWISLVPS
jgi:hypothetical protein